MSLSTSAVFALLLTFVALTGCVRREGRNSDCRWPGEPAANAIDPSRPGYQRHLREDVEFAQELAVEYMDAHHGPRSGEFKSQQTASEALNACLSMLMARIAKSHNLPRQDVATFLGGRSFATDFAMTLPFVLLYGLLAVILAGKLRRRYHLPEDRWTTALARTILSSLAFAAGGMMLGEQWST